MKRFALRGGTSGSLIATALLLMGLTGTTLAAFVGQAPPAAELQQKLLHSVLQDEVENVAELLRQGGDPNARTSPGKEDAGMCEMISRDDPAPPVFLTACRFGSIQGPKVIELLLEKGANVNLPDRNGVTPLMVSATLGVSVPLLLEHGAKVNGKDNRDKTPLMYAMNNRGLNSVALLLNKGADINAQDRFGRTPLMYAIVEAVHDPVRLYGEDLAAKARTEKAAHKELVAYLIEKKADIRLKDREGDTALSLAKKQRRTEIVELLRGAGAKE